MVYAYVVGEETVHLTLSTKKQRFSHFVCQEERDDVGHGHERGLCGCKVLVAGKAQSKRLDRASTGILAVCWRM